MRGLTEQEALLVEGQALIVRKLARILDKNPHPQTGTLGQIMGLAQALGMTCGGYLAPLSQDEHAEFLSIVFKAIEDHKDDYIESVYGGVVGEAAGNA